MHGEGAWEEHHDEDDGGDDDHADFDVPVDIGRIHRDGDEACDDEASGPAGVKDVQPLGFVFAEHGGDDGVDVGLDGAVGKSEQEAAPENHGVGEVRVAVTAIGDVEGADGDDGPGHITGKGDEHGDLVADFVDEEAEENNGDGEGPNADAGEAARFDGVEAELFGPDADEEHAADERERGGDQGDETAPKQYFILFGVH